MVGAIDRECAIARSRSQDAATPLFFSQVNLCTLGCMSLVFNNFIFVTCLKT
jgi:hypothetical protein